MAAIMFDDVPIGCTPIYEAGTDLGWSRWDLQASRWVDVDPGENAVRRGHGNLVIPLSSVPVSRELASDEVRKMRESLPPGRGMIVAWERTEPGFLRISAGSCQLADLDYGPSPDWVR